MFNALRVASLAAFVLIALPVGAALKLSVVDDPEKLSPPRGKVGWTHVTAGNSKGQTFTVASHRNQFRLGY